MVQFLQFTADKLLNTLYDCKQYFSDNDHGKKVTFNTLQLNNSTFTLWGYQNKQLFWSSVFGSYLL